MPRKSHFWPAPLSLICWPVSAPWGGGERTHRFTFLCTPTRTASLAAHTNTHRFTICAHQHAPLHLMCTLTRTTSPYAHTNMHRFTCCAHQHHPLHFMRTPTRTASLAAHTSTHHFTGARGGQRETVCACERENGRVGGCESGRVGERESGRVGGWEGGKELEN